MPFTVKLFERRAVEFMDKLHVLLESSRFTAKLEPGPCDKYTAQVVLKPVRLREAKLYCGQHPGECQLGAKRKSRCLEWDDWVEFNDLVNDVLDTMNVEADSWSCPPELLDQGKKMFIRRKGLGRRVRYEWSERIEPKFGNKVIRIWNHGTDNQFR